MKKKIFISASALILLFSGTIAFASSSTKDVLSKLQNIQNDVQTEDSSNLDVNLDTVISSVPSNDASQNTTVTSTDTNNIGEDISVPSAEDVKKNLGSNFNLQDLKDNANQDQSSSSYFKLAVGEELKGNKPEAIANLDKAIKVSPLNLNSYKELINLYQTEGEHKIYVYVNGSKIDFSGVDPVVRDGRTLVPIRKITEQLGADVTWDNDKNIATIKLNGTVIQLIQDSKDASINGETKKLDVPAQNINGHILVPLRFISESFNQTVNYFPGDNDTAVIPIFNKQ
jgi:tetratricopeptide (TPR) repeat protein